jgi:dienelactone hydrolase
MEWSIRSILNTVITRLLIYETNPIDLEYVLSKVENKKFLNASMLAKSWIDEWEKKANKYIELANEAKDKNHKKSAEIYYSFASQCYYATFLVNQADIEEKKYTYKMYAKCFSEYVNLIESHKTYKLKINSNRNLISAYLFRPKNELYKNACTVIYPGFGSCKEELYLLAKPLLDRGISVCVADAPGTGESLFDYGNTCNIENLKPAFKAVLDELELKYEFNKFCSYGLCMGGGYSYYTASNDKRYNMCVNLFPLLITKSDLTKIPIWMKKGKWYVYQTGDTEGKNDFYNGIKELEGGNMNIPYFMVHTKYDNWMTIDNVMDLYNKVNSKKEILLIDEDPVIAKGENATHAMPVGEQLHWIKNLASDWIIDEFERICETNNGQ